MAYSLEVDRRRDGAVTVVRAPGPFARGLGLAFQAVGGAFLLAMPVVVPSGGAGGFASVLSAATVGLGLGTAIRRIRRHVQADRRRRMVSAEWRMNERALPFGACRLEFGDAGGYAEVRRLIAHDREHAAPSPLWAVRVTPAGSAAPTTLLYTDAPEEAERIATLVAEALALDFLGTANVARGAARPPHRRRMPSLSA